MYKKPTNYKCAKLILAIISTRYSDFFKIYQILLIFHIKFQLNYSSKYIYIKNYRSNQQ